MAALFPNASYFNVGEINQINQANSQSPEDVALRELHAHISDVAMHTSSARVDAPKCHEDTREAVQQDVLSWTEACAPGESPRMGQPASTEASGRPEPSSSNSETPHGIVGAKVGDEILWLTGPAGTGKTAIMGTVSERLESAGQLAATFYFSASRGAAGTTSKEFFVTTLAYQMVVHPGLNDRLAPPMLAVIRKNPAVFRMSLERQLEILILAPLRALEVVTKPALPVPTSIIVDGVDECGGSDGRSRQENQLEVLSVILKATKDPAFPFRIIVASRPETWIRGYLEDAACGRVHEIFLDEKYSPDDDIRLYLKSKLAEKGRRSRISSAWPREEDIEKLVENASGQFIYAATVARWVNTPRTSPRAQLDAVLSVKIQPGAKHHPLAVLDALYTSILKSTPDSDETMLWVKGLHYIQNIHRVVNVKPSAWTLDCLFESHQGQAHSILGGLPSLVYKVASQGTDLKFWRQNYGNSIPDDLLDPEWEASYSFYHKSFLDYLNDKSRCGGEFPNLDEKTVKAWLAGRISQTLKSPGVEVSIPKDHFHVFQRCFLDIVVVITLDRSMSLDVNVLERCVPQEWFNVLEVTPELYSNPTHILRALYILVHSNVSAPAGSIHTTDRTPVPSGPALQPRLQAVERGNLKAPKRAMEKSQTPYAVDKRGSPTRPVLHQAPPPCDDSRLSDVGGKEDGTGVSRVNEQVCV